jgi:hypothetical protein
MPIAMNAHATLVTVWFLTGIASVLGSMLGGIWGPSALFAGAIIGGPFGVAAGVWIATTLKWIPRRARGRAIAWGILGFAIAAPIAVMNLHTPVTPVLICALAGVGALVGVGRAS